MVKARGDSPNSVVIDCRMLLNHSRYVEGTALLDLTARLQSLRRITRGVAAVSEAPVASGLCVDVGV